MITRNLYEIVTAMIHQRREAKFAYYYFCFWRPSGTVASRRVEANVRL
jgi:hypothetical protein